MRQGVMEYAGKKLKELSAYLGEKNWFAGETVCIIAHIARLGEYTVWRMYIVLCVIQHVHQSLFA